MNSDDAKILVIVAGVVIAIASLILFTVSGFVTIAVEEQDKKCKAQYGSEWVNKSDSDLDICTNDKGEVRVIR